MFAPFFDSQPGLYNYLLNVSERFRYVYVETPKVGCSSIKATLQRLEVDGDASRAPAYVHDKVASPLLSPTDIQKPPSDYLAGDEYFRFCFIRNPTTRILSAYLDKIVGNNFERARVAPPLGLPPDRPCAFHEFLEALLAVPDPQRDAHFQSQTGLLAVDAVAYHIVGRFERFEETFAAVLNRIAPGAADGMIRVDHHRTGAAQVVNDHVGPRERALLLGLFQEDYRRFCYSPDPVFATL